MIYCIHPDQPALASDILSVDTSAQQPSWQRKRYLYLIAFISGMATLAIELSASRLLGSVFGNSNLVWANVIGLMLLYLTAGYFIGGRIADRYPREDALLRPNPGFSFAAHKAEVERLAAEWHADNPGVRLVVLRPVTAVAAGESSWAARTLRAAVTVAAGDDDSPVQFLHLDDLAAAVELAVLGDLAGTYNVAPDGYVSATRMRRLSGMVPWLRVPPQVASWLARFRWRWRLAPTPPGVVPYTRFPWVVSNERLRAAGWEPRHSNEECYVDSHHAKPWAITTSSVMQRRSLTVLVALVAIGLGIAIGAMARARRAARPPLR